MTPRTLDELRDQSDPLWPIVEGWLAEAAHPVTVLPAAPSTAEAALLTLQVTTRSPLGAMAYHTGGILVDSGWLRLLGSGCDRLRDSLLTWNALAEPAVADPLAGAMLIAHDVLGGFFAVNLGAFGPGQRTVFYFAPDALRWSDLDLAYVDFLNWAITGDVAGFYSGLRWPGWQQEIVALTADQGLSFWPMLWTSEPALADRSRKAVPQRELWSLHRDLARQMADLPLGSRVSLRFTDEH